ncbi:hypothetical protein [Methanoculleus chikugoensis]|uniref:AMP-binding enzyme n=1 Tax=Methanoculleus chikugoensis TaxID=118126 RepID=UPI001FB46BD5|nr:hypothetical protein [Methanoculleus chikugoensis]
MLHRRRPRGEGRGRLHHGPRPGGRPDRRRRAQHRDGRGRERARLPRRGGGGRGDRETRPPLKGHVIKAFVTLRVGVSPPGDGLTDDLARHVRKSLGPVAVPAEIEFMDRLPKTRSGKIMRRVLKARELGMDPGDISTLEE